MTPTFSGEPAGEVPTDVQLVQRFQRGDDRAFVTLMERHERRVYNLAFRMLGKADDARDASQDAFLSCYRNLRRFRGDSAFSTWLHRITVNACYDMLRKKGPTPARQDELPEPPPTPDHAEQASLSIDVQRALLAIPPEFRAALILHDLQDVSVEDVAAMLDVPVGTVKSRLHRGRAAMGRALGVRPGAGVRPDPGEPHPAPASSKPPSP
jgi:RNA polymerase sigma-70 factor, ECF subfamily